MAPRTHWRDTALMKDTLWNEHIRAAENTRAAQEGLMRCAWGTAARGQGERKREGAEDELSPFGCGEGSGQARAPATRSSGGERGGAPSHWSQSLALGTAPGEDTRSTAFSCSFEPEWGPE